MVLILVNVGAKDVWDDSSKNKEVLLYEELLSELHEALPNLKITRFGKRVHNVFIT